MLSLLVTLISFWLFVHYLYRRFKSIEILPSTRHAASTRAPALRLGKLQLNSANTTVSLTSLVHLTIQTTAFNKIYDRFVSHTSNPKSRNLRRALDIFYKSGIVFGCLGMLTGLVILAWSNWTLVRKIVLSGLPPPPEPPTPHRRDMNSHGYTSELNVNPIIPGVTVPLSDLFFIVPAILLSQIFHELGHAVSGALHRLPLLSGGISLWLLFPSAFVSFPSHAVNSLPSTARTATIAAGPWHNFILYLLLVTGRLASTRLFNNLPLFATVSAGQGVAIVEVNTESALYEHVQAGAIIIALNDLRLNQTDPPTRLQVWRTALLDTTTFDYGDQGWCVEPDVFLPSAKNCCSTPGSSETLLSCFFDVDTMSKGCLEPFSVLTVASRRRCTHGDGRCNCVLPVADENLLRLTLLEGDETERVVLWKGPRPEVFADVSVATGLPRIGRHNLPFFMILIGDMLALLWGYMEIANMSLALLNLLPLPHLDGEAFLHALEPVFKMRSREDLEAMDFELQDDDDPQSLTVRRSTSSSPFRLFFGGVKMGTALMVLVFVSLSAWMMIVMR